VTDAAPATMPGSALDRLDALMRQREALWPPYEATRHRLAGRFGADALDDWASGVFELFHVNAGRACLIAFWTLSDHLPAGEELSSLNAAAQAGANICRHAGARAATATIAAFPVAQRLLAPNAPPARWWRIMETLARQAPESVEAAASRMAQIFHAGDLDGLADFVAAGIKAAAAKKARRLAFFSLQDEFAQRLIARASVGIGFAEVERPTKAFVTALWRRPPALRSLPIAQGHANQRRTSIAGPLIRLPDAWRGIADEAVPALYRAAVAHAQAHLVFGGARFPIGPLKPLQVALVTLIEDARVEMLAMRQLPGLRRLWSTYHIARPTGVATAPMLLARLARALFDPDHIDDDGFVGKGRRLFDAARNRLHDPGLSREIGVLLGNDLGQMRVQFNARTYAVEPLYRDDGLGLWDFGEDAPVSEEMLELFVDATQSDERDAGGTTPDTTAGDGGRARPVAPDRRGRVIASYPEWDHVAGLERADWTTVREVEAQPGDPRLIEAALDGASALRSRVARLVRGVRVGRTVRLKRQHDGHDLDVDAMIEAGIALRIGQSPDPRIFRSSAATHRDLAVLLLIDISQSTRDRLASGATILDVERLAVAVLAEAMQALGDPFSLLAFASNGRDDVGMTNVKAFDELYDRHAVSRLAGLSPGLSTRLGTALRHAGSVIGATRSFRKLVIVLTDGEPSDVDADPLDLVEDARRAALGLKRGGIDGFGVVLGEGGIQAATRIFGRGNTMLVHRAEDLPARLSELYFRLARR